MHPSMYGTLPDWCRLGKGPGAHLGGRAHLRGVFRHFWRGHRNPPAGVGAEELPYLQSVASPGDALPAVSFHRQPDGGGAAAGRREAAWPGEGAALEGPVEDWISQVDVSPSGYVTSALVGGRTCTGEELREAFGLRSACFTLDTSRGRVPVLRSRLGPRGGHEPGRGGLPGKPGGKL